MNNREPFVSLCFFNFLELKGKIVIYLENYEHHYNFGSQKSKCSSEKLIPNRIKPLKPIFSHNNFNKLD